MEWRIIYHKAAKKDLDSIDGSCKAQVVKAIRKVAENPLPFTEGGYGKPLGNKNNTNLTGFLKIKLKSLGLRVVYRLDRVGNDMIVIVISVRSDNEVYKIASKRSSNTD